MSMRFPLPGYRVERALARGGFGTILAARRESDDQRVAIKVAHPEVLLASSQLVREAAALAGIGAPTVPALHESGVLDGGLGFLVMELIELPTLAEHLARAAGPVDPPTFARLALALVDAVATVHARSYVHCDLKPENIFVSNAPPTARLIDFGLSRSLSSGSVTPHPARAASGTFEGTAEYMSPEQCAGQVDLDPRSDLYSLGIILYEMLTGRPPFFGIQTDVIQAHLTRRPPPPSDFAPVAPAVEEVILRLLTKERARRFGSARELAIVLRDVLAHKAEITASRAPAAPSAARAIQTRRPMAVLFMAVRSDAITLQLALASYGGQLAFSIGGHCAAVFDLDASENPMRRALRAAQGLLDAGVLSAALLDLSPVTTQRRPNGALRFLASIFNRKDLYPDPERGGILFTTPATEVLPELSFVPVPDREGLMQLALPGSSSPRTAPLFRVGIEALVGRDQEVSLLVESARAAVRDGVPTLAAVVGEAGFGKSHLCAALIEQLDQHLPNAQILSFRAREPLHGDVDETLRILLHRGLGLSDGSPSTAPPDRGRGALIRSLGPASGEELWPAVAATLGWLPLDAPELKHLGAAPGVLRAMALRAAGEALRAQAREAPLLVLLDDAHFADDASLDALEYATLAEARVPLWICLLTRPGLERARPALGSRAARQEWIRLDPLAAEEAERLCRALLRPAVNVPAEAVARIIERTQRVPLFLVELVHGLKRQGLVRPRTGGTWYLATDELDLVPELPLVEWLADRELSSLSPELVPYVRLCALLEGEFTPAEVEGIVRELERHSEADDFPLDPGHATRRLLELGLFTESRGAALSFRNPLLREAVSHSMTEPWRERIHLCAFRYYIHHWAAPEERRIPRIAAHAAGAGMRDEAAALYLDLAEAARDRHAYLEAEATYSRAIELLPMPEDMLHLFAYKGRGQMRYRVGRYEDSLADFARARQLARARRDLRAEAELLLDEATALDWINDYARSEVRVIEAGTLALQVSSAELHARLKLAIGRSQFRNGRRKEACASLEEAAALAEPLGDAGYETRVVALLMLGAVLPHLNRIDEAEQALQRVVTLCTERRDRLHLGSAINNRRNLWVARRNLARAIEDQLQFMQIGRELGMVGWEYFAEYNLGELLYHSGNLEAAVPHVLRAIALERQHPEIAPRPLGLLLRARLLAYQGEREQARVVLEEIQAALERARAHGRVGSELAPSEEVLFQMVELSTREATPQEWRALRARSLERSVEQEPIEVAEMMGLALLRQGHVKEALWNLEDARSLAGQIPNLMEERIRRTLEWALSSTRAPPPPPAPR